jgi:hypothetical protein
MNKSFILPAQRPLVRAVRGFARDNARESFDIGQFAMDALCNGRGKPFERPVRMAPYQANDGRWVNNRVADSSGAFLVGELERLDQKLHEPLVSYFWSRDIDLRTDVTLADEVSSYTLSTFGSAGSLGAGNGIGNGKAWIGKATDQITGVSVDIAKVTNPLTLWGEELKYTIPELESAAKLGRPIDQQKYAGLTLKHEMDVDEQVYIGDTTLGVTGMLNSDTRSGLGGVTNVANVVNGATGNSQWSSKTPDEILTDVNEILTSAWRTAAYAVMPNRLLVPPTQFGYISTQKISLAGNTSILTYLLENNISVKEGKTDLQILPTKWAVGAGVGGTIGTLGTVDRMMAYHKLEELIRFPKTLLQRTPIQYDSIWHKSTYYCRLGVVEIVYPETVAYRDGI